MIVVVLMALNVGQRLNHIISAHRFGGGSARCGILTPCGRGCSDEETSVEISLDGERSSMRPDFPDTVRHVGSRVRAASRTLVVLTTFRGKAPRRAPVRTATTARRENLMSLSTDDMQR